jgi:SsrA-binding protein
MTTYLKNKHATFNYEILDRYEAGIVLHGYEVKSIKKNHGSLKEAYITTDGDEVFLIKAHIPAYQPANTPDSFDPYRRRKLLLHKHEIVKLHATLNEQGLTIIPISMYNKGNTIKLEIALVRGKKKHDKRETIKKRDADRDMRRIMKELR